MARKTPNDGVQLSLDDLLNELLEEDTQNDLSPRDSAMDIQHVETMGGSQSGLFTIPDQSNEAMADPVSRRNTRTSGHGEPTHSTTKRNRLVGLRNGGKPERTDGRAVPGSRRNATNGEGSRGADSPSSELRGVGTPSGNHDGSEHGASRTDESGSTTSSNQQDERPSSTLRPTPRPSTPGDTDSVAHSVVDSRSTTDRTANPAVDSSPQRRTMAGTSMGSDQPATTSVDNAVPTPVAQPAQTVSANENEPNAVQGKANFKPSGQTTTTPRGLKTRAAANIAAIRLLQELDNEERAATPTEQKALAQWSGWGGLSSIFDETKEDWEPLRDQLRDLLSEDEWKYARSGVMNAHYTHPAYVSTIWNALEANGVVQGQVLEPGCGSGTFIGLAPDGVQMTGVELDPTTASVAKYLYPNAQIRNEGYETTPTTHLYDAAVGNVPFGDVKLFDPANNPGNHSIHNHFIIKALAQTKPGGYVSVLTSRYTMDAANPAARRDMYEHADLVTAIRLPGGAHSEVADTEAVTDLLVLRVRKDGESPRPFDWEHANKTSLDTDNEAVSVNDYFTTHNQQNVIGQMSIGHGMYNANTLQVNAVDESGKKLNATQISASLETLLNENLDTAKANGLNYAPENVEIKQATTIRGNRHDIGSLRKVGDQFEQLSDSGWESIDVPKTQREELDTLLDLRDQTRNLLEMESATIQDTPEMEAARQQLATAYDEYRQQYGPINRVTKTARLKKNGEESLTIRRPPVMSRFFNKDPFSALTRAIEVFDEETEIAKPAPILSSRQVFAKYTPKGCDTPADALAISMQTKGNIDLEYCAYLLGYSTPEQAREALDTLVFDTPQGDLVSAEEYLSGNVRNKLEQARNAAETNPAFEANVQALEEVMPRELGITDITPTPGASWIPPTDHQAFIREALDIYGMEVTYNPAEGWGVRGSRMGIQQRRIWGTEQMSATEIFEAVLNNKPIRVTSEDEEGRRHLNVKATEAAKGKAEQIETKFKQWIWQNPSRTERLLTEYNKRFNSLVPRSYDQSGVTLRLPGLAKSFELRKHQKSAVARMIAEPSTGLFHAVGAGKTLEMACGVMEQKRLGLINKPMVVVPNHMLGQFEREWLQAYPQARILAADIDDISSKTGRGDFMARVTTSPWDAVICTQSAFKKIGVSYETYEAYESEQIEALEAWMNESTDRISVQRAENKRQKLVQDLAKARAKHENKTDGGVTFEQLGVDYLVIDEAHDFKNLGANTKLEGVIPSDSSGKSKDLDMKLGWLRKTHGDRAVTFATATPIANTMGEMWVMTHYLRPDLLENAGLYTFDAWAKTFTGIDTKIETTVGQKFKMRQRVARFQNMPELMTMWSTFADVKTIDQLDIKIPQLAKNAEGKRAPQIVTVNIGDAMDQFNQTVQDRAEAIDKGMVQPWEDNFLALTHDGRTMATDYRLLKGKSSERAIPEPLEPIGAQKVDVAADQIARIYFETRGNTYLDDTEAESDVTGALQLVFSDQGTPKPNEWNIYDELKNQLVARGVPAEKIAFTHDAKTSVEKDRIFARARSGAINVLIGSTQKMGTGANMQTRAIALHHLTAPWRPADLAQRDGRVVRQYNQNKEVQIYRYVTEGSFDTYMWQTLERKASFINQIMTNKLDGREIEDADISNEEASYAQVKAIASGNPLIMEEARLKNEVSKYKARNDAFVSQQHYLQSKQPGMLRQVENLRRQADIRDNIAKTTTSGQDPTFTIAGTTYATRKDAATALRDHLNTHADLSQNALPHVDFYRRGIAGFTMQIGGLQYELGIMPQLRDLTGRIEQNAPTRITAVLTDLKHNRSYSQDGGVTFTLKSLNESSQAIGVIRRLENHVEKLHTDAEKLRQKAESVLADYERATLELEQSNPWADKLQTAKNELSAIRKQMAQAEQGQDTLEAPSATTTPQARPRFLGVDPRPDLRKAKNPTTDPLAPPLATNTPARSISHNM